MRKFIINKHFSEQELNEFQYQYCQKRFISPEILCGIRSESRDSRAHLKCKPSPTIKLSNPKHSFNRSVCKNLNLDLEEFKKLMKNKIVVNKQLNSKQADYSISKDSIKEVEGMPPLESKKVVSLPRIVPTYNSEEEKVEGSSKWNDIIAIQGSQKELDSSSPQKKEVQINYPKLRRRSSESILNFKEPICTDLVEVQLPKSKSPRKPKVLKKKKINNIERIQERYLEENINTSFRNKMSENFGNA